MKRSERITKEQTRELESFIKNKSCSAKEVKRAQAILLLDKMVGEELIKAATGYSRRRIYFCRQIYLQKGLEGITDKRKKAVRYILNKKQRQEINSILSNESPLAYGYKNNAYWTTKILADLIKTRYGVCYKSRTSYYLLFKENKFTFHKPGRVYEKYDPIRVALWQEEMKPILEKAWSEKDTVILTGDEMILSNQTTFQKIWLPQGQYPKIEVSNSKENRSLYGFLAIKTGRTHTYKEQKQNMFITAKCLCRLRKIYPGKKLIIFWDNAGWHRGSAVQKFIVADKNIQAIYFPPYSPEENPQEHVWKAGRTHITHNRFIKNLDDIIKEFIAYLKSNIFRYSLLGFSAVL
jgi:transposase